jgi:hypothetical protein
MFDAITFAYIVVGFALSFSVLAFIGIIFSDKPGKGLMSNDEYDKKVIKKRKKKK